MNYWQVAAGQGTRDYSDVFLKYGVILIGPGNPGPVSENRTSYVKHPKGARVIAFAEDLKHGDRVILKRGHRKKGRILAVGQVTGGYDWLEQFEDVDGWDLQHCRRVKWIKPANPIPVEGLARGTISRTDEGNLILKDAADSLLKEGNWAETSEIPQPANGISIDDLAGSLIDNGLRPANAEKVVEDIKQVRCLADWYRRYGRALSEHEIRTFLIVPILLALGWSEKSIKIEWKYTDVSLFREPLKRGVKAGDPHVILESKRLQSGLNLAERQVVRKYASKSPGCNMLVTSSGARYQLYTKKLDNKWDARGMKENHLSAYMNLFKLKDRHPYLPGVGGAPDLLKSLMPG